MDSSTSFTKKMRELMTKLFIKDSLLENELSSRSTLTSHPNAETAKAMIEVLKGENVERFSSVDNWWQSNIAD